MKHSLERTSPKGGKFIGTCTLCGVAGLTIADSQKDCENVRGLTYDDAVMEAILGPKSVRPDYANMTDPELLDACGDNGMAWAEAFCQIAAENNWTMKDIDEGMMVAWFANAIEASHDKRTRNSH